MQIFSGYTVSCSLLPLVQCLFALQPGISGFNQLYSAVIQLGIRFPKDPDPASNIDMDPDKDPDLYSYLLCSLAFQASINSIALSSN